MGFPNRYDARQTKIRGVPPNPQLAIESLQMAIGYGYLQGWIDMVEMYHYGFYDFPSDLDRAENICIYITQNIRDTGIIGQAYRLYQEIRQENERIKTYRWLNLPYTSPIQPKKTRYELAGTKTTGTGTGHIWRHLTPDQDTTPETVVDLQTLFEANDANHDEGTGVETGAGAIKNDMHNVHDHSVIATIKQSIDQLQKETPISKNSTQCLYEIRNYLNTLPNNDKKTDAIMALDSIEQAYMPLSFTDLKETDALTLVWNRIHSDVHKDNAAALKENLTDELAECIEHDKPVCSTGKMTRILDTLNVVDEAVRIKPTFMINQEMMEKSAKLRNDAYNQLDDTGRSQVDSLAPNDFQKQWTATLKDKIRHQFAEDYVKTDIMTQSAFDAETSKWIDEI